MSDETPIEKAREEKLSTNQQRIHVLVNEIEARLGELGMLCAKTTRRDAEWKDRQGRIMGNLLSAADLITFASANISDLIQKPHIHGV